MTPLEMFEETQKGPWETVGLQTQYRIEPVRKLLIFQESVQPIDWLLDFEAWPSRFLGEFVHHGYLNAFIEFKETQITDINQDWQIIGYSHGGALAILFAWVYGWSNPQSSLLTTTFATPNIFWLHAPKNLSITRYEVLGDIIPHLPPRILGYCNPGRRIPVGKPHCLAIKQHYPDTYQKALSQL